MLRRFAAFVLLAGCVTVSLAQLRTIPDDAARGVIRHLQEMTVEIDGAPRRLAPGAQIRNETNLIVVPGAIPAGTPVKYKLDDAGLVREVWFLTPKEAAQADKNK
jgi:hypothetical protein